MRPKWYAKLVALCCLLCLGAPLQAAVVEVEGWAPIEQGDVGRAREDALRNALAEAARGAGARVQSVESVRDFVLEKSQTTVRADARVINHTVLSEKRDGDRYQVRLRVQLSDAPPDEKTQDGVRVCRGGYVKRLLIGGFPLKRPLELGTDELGGYARLTAGEMARYMDGDLPLLVDTEGSLQVRFALPEMVTTDVPLQFQAWQKIRDAARRHRAQYVLLGQFRNLATAHSGQKIERLLDGAPNRRTIELDALIIDAHSSACVARQRFAAEIGRIRVLQAERSLRVPQTADFGSAAHFDTPFGAAWLDVIRRAANWAGAYTTCLPFGVRVVKVEGGRVYLDAGAEQGLARGDQLTALRVARDAVISADGEILGLEKEGAGQVRVVKVYPRFAIAEMPEGAEPLKAGDELFGS